MAVQLLQENNVFNINRKHFLLDEENELTTLENQYDCLMGDIAELADGTIYYRHSDNYQGDLWELKESSSGTNKLPTVTGNDEGKALRVNSSGNWVASDLPEELPYVTSEDNGKILKVSNGYWDVKEGMGTYTYEVILDTTSFTTIDTQYGAMCEEVCNLERINNGDIIKVTFNDEEYEVIADISHYGKVLGEKVLGEHSFENYPFYINTPTFPCNANLYTEEPGTYTLKIERQIITPSKEFTDAVVESIKYIKFMTLNLVGEDKVSCNYSRTELLAIFNSEAPYIATINGVTCSSAFQWNSSDYCYEFHAFKIIQDNGSSYLRDEIITIEQSSTPEFSYSVNEYELTSVE